MTNTQEETRGAAHRCCRLLGFVFLVLVLSLGSVAASAAPQALKGGEDKTPCRITRINAKTGVVSASVIEGSPAGGAQSFRFFVKDTVLRNSLKEGQEILADFDAQEVFTSAGASGQIVRLGGILTDYYGKNSGGPAGGSGTVGGNMGGGIGGAGQSQAGSASGPPSQSGGVGNPLGGQNLGNTTNPSFGNAGGVGDTVAGQNLGNAANPGQPNCQITNIDAATGLVRAKNLSTGQEFQFMVKDPAQLRSLNVGESFFANLDSHQVSFDGKSLSGMQSFSFFDAGTKN